MENEDGVQERTIPQNNQGKYQPSNKTQPVKYPRNQIQNRYQPHKRSWWTTTTKQPKKARHEDARGSSSRGERAPLPKSGSHPLLVRLTQGAYGTVRSESDRSVKILKSWLWSSWLVAGRTHDIFKCISVEMAIKGVWRHTGINTKQ